MLLISQKTLTSLLQKLYFSQLPSNYVNLKILLQRTSFQWTAHRFAALKVLQIVKKFLLQAFMGWLGATYIYIYMRNKDASKN